MLSEVSVPSGEVVLCEVVERCVEKRKRIEDKAEKKAVYMLLRIAEYLPLDRVHLPISNGGCLRGTHWYQKRQKLERGCQDPGSVSRLRIH